MEPAPELTARVREYYAGMTAGDVARCRSFYSDAPASLHIGTDPEEWWNDAEAFRGVLERQVPELQGIRFIPGDTSAWKDGAIGWTADRGALELPDRGRVPLRWTAVWRMERGAWRIVQSHASFGVPNAESIRRDLPAR